ncbi:MAG: methyltransferase regulatory domain-containing protein, partial [Bdellovibrionales bacterium]|nr:methyltransferase regulatory domain-containing protein [Bdellovibrionales bacterium]
RKTLEQGRFEGAEGPQLKEEAMQCNKQSDAFIFHELLAEHNQAFFVSQFAELLANHQLQYFGDGNPTRMRVWRFEEETQLVQPDIPIEQPIEKEQWLDQQKPVPLRGALLGKQDLSALDQFRVEVIETCHLASPLVAKTDPPDIHSSTIEVFIGPREQTVEVADPVLKAALLILQRNWPATVGFFELTALAVEMALGKSVTHQLRRELAETLLPYFLCGLLEIYSEPLPCISKIEQHPHAFASARVIASLRNWTTSAKHEYVPLGPFEQQLLPLLDGTRDRTELLQAMHQKLVSGELGIKEADAWTEAQQQQAIEQQVDQSLYFFSEHGLLSASPTDL